MRHHDQTCLIMIVIVIMNVNRYCPDAIKLGYDLVRVVDSRIQCCPNGGQFDYVRSFSHAHHGAYV